MTAKFDQMIINSIHSKTYDPAERRLMITQKDESNKVIGVIGYTPNQAKHKLLPILDLMANAEIKGIDLPTGVTDSETAKQLIPVILDFVNGVNDLDKNTQTKRCRFCTTELPDAQTHLRYHHASLCPECMIQFRDMYKAGLKGEHDAFIQIGFLIRAMFPAEPDRCMEIFEWIRELAQADNLLTSQEVPESTTRPNHTSH